MFRIFIFLHEQLLFVFSFINVLFEHVNIAHTATIFEPIQTITLTPKTQLFSAVSKEPHNEWKLLRQKVTSSFLNISVSVEIMYKPLVIVIIKHFSLAQVAKANLTLCKTIRRTDCYHTYLVFVVTIYSGTSLIRLCL